MFNIQFKDIIAKLLPPRYRSSDLKELLNAAIKPLTNLNGTFFNWKNKIDYELLFNGQTIYLTHVLNDSFDNTPRRIYIEDTSNISYTYLFNEIELREKFYLHNDSESKPPVYLENRSEQVNQVHFIVRVPVSLVFSEIQMRALVDKYKQAGKIYTIQTY